MKKTLILLVAIIGSSILSKAQTTVSGSSTSGPSIHWMSIQEAEKQNKKHPKKILIDTYTDWCGWCKRLDATTWTDARIVDYVNKNYYAVKLNAETHDTIKYQGRVYTFNPAQRTNDIMAYLTDGKLSGYPTIIFLDESLNDLTIIPGYQAADPMNNIVHYFGDNIYKTVDWTAYSSDPSKYLKN